MLERVDRVQLAVRDRQSAARTFHALLGAEPARQAESRHLGAWRTVIVLGESELELCEPAGPGPVQDHLDRWGEGLLTAGFSVPRVAAFREHLQTRGIPFVAEGDQTYLDPAQTAGMRVVVSPGRPRERTGPVSRLYEVTNTLVSDWRAVAERYTLLFALDASGFSPIRSERFGYVGTLALFDPPRRLDRIELSQVVDGRSAMGRWVTRRGDSLYMAYAESDDVAAIVARLRAAGARFTPRGADPLAEREGLWIHPGALHGLLLGVSRTTLAWEWSGRPDLVAPLPPS